MVRAGALATKLSALRAPAVFDSYLLAAGAVWEAAQSLLNQTPKLALSTDTPGPMVEDTVILRKYTPFAALGLAF